MNKFTVYNTSPELGNEFVRIAQEHALGKHIIEVRLYDVTVDFFYHPLDSNGNMYLVDEKGMSIDMKDTHYLTNEEYDKLTIAVKKATLPKSCLDGLTLMLPIMPEEEVEPLEAV